MEIKNVRRENFSFLIKDALSNGRTKKAFAKLAGISPPQVGQFLSGNRNIGDFLARRMEEHLSLDRGWFDIQHDEIKESDVKNISKDNYRVEILDTSVNGNLASSEITEKIIAIEYTQEQAIMLFENKPSNIVKIANVSSDSMSGTIERDDLIFIDTSVTQYNGDGIYVFVFNGHLHVKRLQMAGKKLTVLPDNPKYIEWVIENHDIDNLHINGKVLLSLPQKFNRYA